MSSKKYVLGSIQIVDGTQGSGKLLTSDVNGLSTWGFSVPTIDITRDDLYLGLTSSTLTKGAIYYITDKKIWLKALDVNLISNSGQRKMTIVRNEAYRSTLPNTYGIWKETGITYSIGDKVVWGATVWENLTGNVGYWDYGSGDYGWSVSTILGPPEDWISISNSNTTYYVDKIFDVKYDIIEDFIYSQSDDRGNIIYSQNPIVNTYEPLSIEKTDWGDNLTTNNINNGPIVNNIGVVNDNRFCGYINQNIGNIISNSNISGGISRNTSTNTGNYGGIYNNDLGNNSYFGITNNTLFYNIRFNTNSGGIYANNIQGAITDNSNNGNINQNNGIGNIIGNSNAGGIAFNILSSSISYNNNNGSISSNNLSAPGTDFMIAYNSNNGNITSNTQTSGNTSILYNNNNGKIMGARTGNVIGTIVDI